MEGSEVQHGLIHGLRASLQTCMEGSEVQLGVIHGFTDSPMLCIDGSEAGDELGIAAIW